jgi:hypothetical protein
MFTSPVFLLDLICFLELICFLLFSSPVSILALICACSVSSFMLCMSSTVPLFRWIGSCQSYSTSSECTELSDVAVVYDLCSISHSV